MCSDASVSYNTGGCVVMTLYHNTGGCGDATVSYNTGGCVVIETIFEGVC